MTRSPHSARRMRLRAGERTDRIAPGRSQCSGLEAKNPNGDVKTLSAEDRQIIKELGLTEEEFRKANGLTAA